MKKKICYCLILFLTLSINNVNAAKGTCEGLKSSDLPTLSMSQVQNNTFVALFSDIFPDHSTTYFQMSLDGYPSLCVTRGAPARSGNKYIYNGISTNVNYNMAFGFYASDDYPGSPIIKWAISQYVAWEGLNDSVIHRLIARDSMIRPAEKPAIGMQTISALRSHGSDKYYVWDNYSISGGQQMVTSLQGCEEIEENSCPKGQMVKNNASLSCYVSKGGNNYTYSNLATTGDRTNVSSKSESGAKGLEMRKIGSFCRLYCEEYGTATLPGAIGESLQLGSFIVWPTSDSNHTNKFSKDSFPLKFNGELQCKIGVIPDEGLPFACERDPIEEYSSYYNYLKNNRNKSTYNRTANVNTLEKMRLDISKWGANDSAPSYNDVYSSCEAAYETNYTQKMYQYSFAKELLNQAREALNKAQSEQDAVNPKTEKKYYNVQMTLWGYEETDAYKAAKRKTAAAQTYYNQKLQIVHDIEAGITACAGYTHKFELARQILKEYKTCAEFDATTDIYNFSASVNLNYSDEEYKNVGDVFTEKLATSSSGEMSGNKGLFGDEIKSDGLKFENLYVQNNKNSGVLTDKVANIKARSFTIIKEMTYTLITNYKYIDKESKKYLTESTNGTNYSSIYTLIKNQDGINLNKDKDSFGGIIPTSYNNKIAYDYYMTLSNISFGMAGFGMDAGGTGSEYKCPVQFTKVSNTTCICPEGTEMEGMDLIGLIANNKMTCSDAQLLYCDKDIDVPHEDMYCPNMPDISIGACVNAGYTKNECIDKLCNERYTCKNTNGVGGKMDITSCVQTKIMQGLTKEQAIDYCDAVVCPIGRTIIYRTIRLENPFPSYDPSQNSYVGLTTGMFNNNTRGRYPGSNWNGILTVYNKIRNNRSDRLETNESTAINDTSTIGTTIYQTKQPLYTFVLNGNTIKQIRTYNESRTDGYNDFNSSKVDDNMDCKINNSTACVSSFVHNSKYGLKSGACYNSTSKTSFYTCARR